MTAVDREFRTANRRLRTANRQPQTANPPRVLDSHSPTMGKKTARQELLPGTLDMLILKSLSLGVMHGYGIAQHIRTVSGEVLHVEEGSLYPALYRMVQKRWIKGDWGVSENNRRAKFYHLTAAGQREFEQQASGWLRLSNAVSRAVTIGDAPPARGQR